MEFLTFQEDIYWRDLGGLTKTVSLDTKADCFHHVISALKTKDVLVFESIQPLLPVAMTFHSFDLT